MIRSKEWRNIATHVSKTKNYNGGVMKTRIRMDKDDRADVGIGTLIVLIAMVLVAAVAAAVLIQTSGVLQQKAQQTGKEATTEVASNLKITSVVGNTVYNGTSTSNIQYLNLTVELSAGGSDIDMTKMVVKYINETKSTTLATLTSAGASSTAFNYSEERVGTGSANNVLQPGDLGLISINLNRTGGIDQELAVRKKGTIQLIPETGTMVIKDVVAPSTFGGKTRIQLFP